MKILLVDDDPQGLQVVRKILERENYNVVIATDGQQALRRAQQSDFDLVVTDVRMPHMGGIEFLRALDITGNKIPVILMTAYGQVKEAVWAMKMGAVDFLTKPFKRQQLLLAVQAALRRLPSPQEIKPSTVLGEQLAGQSEAVRRLREEIQKVARTEATTLIVGESGTGKERVARLIHQLSTRQTSEFVALNCASIPGQLIESELFGHEKGAFSGADKTKIGLFEAADGGTLFLDEIGDMPFALQSSLLRVLQEGEVRRVGSTQSRKVDVRVLSATHQDLEEKAKEGQFRQDLLFRLDVVRVPLSPLRARKDDIPILTRQLLSGFSRRHQKSVAGITDAALSVLTAHPWPGNIRELANTIERAVVFCDDEELDLHHLPEHLLLFSGVAAPAKGGALSIPIGTPLKEVEDMLIQRTLEATAGDKNLTAKILGINSRTIYRKLADKPKRSET